MLKISSFKGTLLWSILTATVMTAKLITVAMVARVVGARLIEGMDVKQQFTHNGCIETVGMKAKH